MTTSVNEEEKRRVALEPVRRFVEESDNEVELYGLTASKILDRAVLVEDAEFPGSVVFEMERPPPILGLPGPANSGIPPRVIRNMRYRFDPEAESLDVVGQIGDSEVDCAVELIAEFYMDDLSFKCVRREDGTVLCKDLSSNGERVVNSAEEAEDFGRSVVESMCLEEVLIGVDDPLTAEQWASLHLDVENACQKIGAQAARQAWEDLPEDDRYADHQKYPRTQFTEMGPSELGRTFLSCLPTEAPRARQPPRSPSIHCPASPALPPSRTDAR